MVTIVDGRKIAGDIRDELAAETQKLNTVPSLHIVIAGENAVTEQFVGMKKRFAEKIGVEFVEYRLQESATQEEVEEAIEKASQKGTGVVIQLPLPKHISVSEAFLKLPAEKDVDVLTDEGIKDFEYGTNPIEPPVQGAVRIILEKNNVSVKGAKVVVVGKGRLVGHPVIVYAKRAGAEVFAVDKNTDILERDKHLKEADIIISGVGVPEIITPDLIKNGVALVDAGTSTAGREVKGDISYDCESKASVFSRTPGGVGPVTVAVLFKNLFVLHKHQQNDKVA